MLYMRYRKFIINVSFPILYNLKSLIKFYLDSYFNHQKISYDMKCPTIILSIKL